MRVYNNQEESIKDIKNQKERYIIVDEMAGVFLTYSIIDTKKGITSYDSGYSYWNENICEMREKQVAIEICTLLNKYNMEYEVKEEKEEEDILDLVKGPF